MANLNRDYLVTLDVKTSIVTLSTPLTFYVTDKRTMNIFVKLVTNESDNPLIRAYSSLENATGYTLEMVLISPNKQPYYLEARLLNGDEALFCFDLDAEQISKIGTWLCELRVHSLVDGVEEVVTSRSFLYSVNQSITTNLDDVVMDNTTYNIIDGLLTRIEALEDTVPGGDNDNRLTLLEATKYDDVAVTNNTTGIVLTFYSQGTTMKQVEIPNDQTLTDRVGALEINVGTLNSEVDILEGSVTALSREIESLEGELNTDITAIEGDITVLEDKVSTLEDRIADIGDDIADRVADCEAEIQEQVEEIASIKQEITSIKATDNTQNTRLAEHETKLQEHEENIVWLLENGGGGSGGGTYISTTTSENVVISEGNDFEVSLDFYSSIPGNGILKVSSNDEDIFSTSIPQGESTVTIPGNLLTAGENIVKMYATDRVGTMTNTLQFKVRYGTTTFTSTFDQYQIYDYGVAVRYYFTPTALDTSDELLFYMKIDDVVQSPVTCYSDERAFFTFPNTLSIGSHYCEAWVEDSYGKSNIMKFNIVILDDSSIAVNSLTRSATVEEGAQLRLDFRAYMKNSSKFIAKTYINNELVNTGECNAETNYYTNSSLKEGQYIIKIEVWDLSQTVSDYVTWNVTITASTYELKVPIVTGATAIFTAKDRNNGDGDKEIWTGQDQDGNAITANLTNFAFNSDSGWVNDELLITGDSYIEIPVAPLVSNARYGFTLDIEFTSKQIGVEDAEVLSLWNDTDNCGIKITTEKLILQSKAGKACSLYFSDNENVSAMFIIDRDEKTAKIYLNGVMCEAFSLSDYTTNGQTYLEDFTVNGNIILGKPGKNGYCKIRHLRVYEVALGTKEILNNWLSNITDKEEQRAMEKFQEGNDLPTLTIYCDFSGLGKDDKKPCDIVYTSTDPNKYGESFSLSGKTSQLQYQGTSSMQYPIKNYRLNLRDSKGSKWYYNPYDGGKPECRFTLKADFMSSGHWQNTGLAKFVSDKLYGYKTNDLSTMNPAKKYDIQNGGTLKDTRDSINGFPCRLILVNDGETPLNAGQEEPTPGNTKDMGIFNFNNDKDNVSSLGLDTDIFPNALSYEVTANSDTSAGAFVPYDSETNADMTELEYLQQSFELRYPDEDDVGSDYGYLGMNDDSNYGLKRVIDWVGNCTDEEFVAHYEEYFDKHYLLRYYLLVITLGMVDNLGKNMMLDTWDGQIWYPRFYDMDTICSYDNSGAIKFDVDIEMEQGYWNTSSSRLWTKVRDLLHDELIETYKDMRGNGLSYEGLMNYFYGEQISKIPQKYYNMDADVKYLPYADTYLGKAHGNGYEHLKRWLKNRLIFTDTLFDYGPSYESDMLTIRANTLDPITFEIETYTPVYQHVSYYNGQMTKLKINGKTATTFTGNAQTATDQEILIYGGSNIKRIRGISSANPDSMLIGSATRLSELDISDCPILTDVNSNKANFSAHGYLNKLNIENCPNLGGVLNLSGCPLLQEVKAKGSGVTSTQFASNVKNLVTVELPASIKELTLIDARSLDTLKFEDGADLQVLSLTDCREIPNTENFDMAKVSTLTLDNSYDKEELYFSENTNLTLKNMPTIERVIYTPNSECEEFNIDNVTNADNYTVTTSNCPKLKTFITTAPHRESYNGDDVEYEQSIEDVTHELLDKYYTVGGYWNDTGTYSEYNEGAFIHYKAILPTAGMEVNFKSLPMGEENSVRVTYFHNGEFLSRYLYGTNYQNTEGIIEETLTPPPLATEIIFVCDGPYMESCSYVEEDVPVTHKIYGYITPNTAFTANTLDLSATQFTDIKLLCTTDIYNLKVPTTMKNFYCDSAMDIDTDVIEDASYEVIHEELIEPYTTNYESEVYRYVTSSFTIEMGIVSDYIDVVGGTMLSFYKYGSLNVLITEYDENKNEIKSTYTSTNGWGIGQFEIQLESNTRYIITNCTNSKVDFTLQQPHTQNIIPSSANGSLIFNMYSNNTTQPTSTSPYMWDLTGLKLEDFYTYGMNNWVKTDESGNITMPQRMSGYSVRLVNADITPINHPVMFYPKLTSKTNAVEGKIDYSKYEKLDLTWAFGYLGGDNVTVIQPADNVLKNYHGYKVYYGPNPLIENPYVVAIFKSTDSTTKPTYRTTDNYNIYATKIEMDGEYFIITIRTPALEHLPTSFTFDTSPGLIAVYGVNTSECTDFGSLFRDCANLEYVNFASFNTSKVTRMRAMFARCYKMKVIDLRTWDMRALKDISNAFYENSETTHIYFPSMTGGQEELIMESTFYRCSNLSFLDMTGFDASKVTSWNNIFAVTPLVNFYPMDNISLSLDLGDSLYLTSESASSLVENLALVSTTQTLTLSSLVVAKLSDEQKTSITEKGWTLYSK